MPELLANQASGLIGLADAVGAQLIAMVNHGDSETDLPLLWQLCSALNALGYPVTVLDATRSESADNAGLLQLLDCRFGHAVFETGASECCVLPAAQGVAQLQDLQQLQELGPLFAHDSVVILYAIAEVLSPLLAGSDVRPLLCTRPEKRSLLTSYTALKRLLLDARLEPTILHMMDDTKPATRHAVSTVSDTLSCCARNFLGYEVSAIRNDSTQTEQQRGALMRQLTLRLLECALPLRSVPAPSFASGRYLQRAAPPQTGRSH